MTMKILKVFVDFSFEAFNDTQLLLLCFAVMLMLVFACEALVGFSVLTLLVGHLEQHPACKK